MHAVLTIGVAVCLRVSRRASVKLHMQWSYMAANTIGIWDMQNSIAPNQTGWRQLMAPVHLAGPAELVYHMSRMHE